jgi:hypothetical protein
MVVEEGPIFCVKLAVDRQPTVEEGFATDRKGTSILPMTDQRKIVDSLKG